MSGANSMRRGYHDLPRPEILALIPAESKRVLDLGCGTGMIGKALKKRQQCHVTGIELNKEASEIAKGNIDLCICDNLNRYNPSLEHVKYDCIIFGDILEHLVSPWAVIQKFSSVLADNGVIIASIPNVSHPNVLWNLKQGLFRYEPAGILDITHLRFFTKTSIFQMFYGAGLKIVSCKSHPSENNPIQYYVTAVKPLPAHKKPTTTILILTFNNWEYTRQCLKSIKEKTQSPYKIVVIDNGSTDETIKELREDLSIYHIENSSNLGFAKGFNVGLVCVDTPYFVLCNSDVVVTPNWLVKMTAQIETDKDLMLLGAVSNHVSGPQRVINVPYKNDTELDEFSKLRMYKEFKGLTYCPRIVFFFTLFKSEALQRIGFLDEIFGLGNFEDDDYCMRVQKKGLKTAFDKAVFIHHYGSRGFGKDPAAFNKLLAKNGQLFLKKWKLQSYGGITKEVDL